MTKIILCADDSVTMQSVAEITLRASAYTYVGAKSADEAMGKAREKKPALVLADAVMTGKTGYDLCQTLKTDPAFADVPVILLCGNSQAYDSARGTAVGADGHLTKPWDTQVLLDKIAELLDRVATSGVAKPGAGGGPSIAPTPPIAPAHPLTTPLGAAPLTPPARPVPPTSPPATPASPAGVSLGAATPGTPLNAASALGSPLNAPKAAVPSPPRSATIMGMPTIAMPPGKAPAVPLSVAPVVPPVAPVSPIASPVVPAAPPAMAPVAQVKQVMPVAVAAPPATSSGARAPMISGAPMKKSQLVERVIAAQTSRLIKEVGLDPNGPEILAIARISAEVIERVVWEVVPDLAEAIIRENLDRLAAARR